MTDETRDLDTTEGTHETAERDLETEIAMAHQKIRNLEMDLLDANYSLDMVRDIARLHMAGTAMSTMLAAGKPLNKKTLDKCIDAADTLADHYQEITNAKVARYNQERNALECAPTGSEN